MIPKRGYKKWIDQSPDNKKSQLCVMWHETLMFVSAKAHTVGATINLLEQCIGPPSYKSRIGIVSNLLAWSFCRSTSDAVFTIALGFRPFKSATYHPCSSL
jgi:hypothetical protein